MRAGVGRSLIRIICLSLLLCMAMAPPGAALPGHNFTYDLGVTRLTRVTDQTGRFIRINYESNAPDFNNQTVLRSVTDAQGNTTTFHYTYLAARPATAPIVSVDRPLGNTPYTQAVADVTLNGAAWARVTSQTDAYSNTTHLAYDSAVNRVTETRPPSTARRTDAHAARGAAADENVIARSGLCDEAISPNAKDCFGPNDRPRNDTPEAILRAGDSTSVTYEHFHNDGAPKRITDATGKVITFSQSANEQVTQVTDRLGDSTHMTYHAASGKLASYQDAEGELTAFSYTAQSQTFTIAGFGFRISDTRAADAQSAVTFTFYDLTRITYPSTMLRAGPDATHDDFTYDARGNALTFTDRRGKTWTATYNSRGQPLTVASPTGGVTTYTYNADGTLASSADSDAGIGTTTYGYDAYKRLSTITRPGGATVQFTYDLNDRLLTVTDERSKTTTFTYDANGNLDTAANPLGQTTSYAQDLMDRVTSITDPVGQVANLSYDALSRLASVADRNGNTTTYGYNSRGWLTGVTDPAGQTWTTAYDDEGAPASTTTPLGFVTAFQTDKLGRVTRITDPVGQVANLSYDELGRLTTLTDRLAAPRPTPTTPQDDSSV